mmetsp:Transcript_27971/g.67398  ORF Transcript_27971/g.67398 Transcript_27971/m.67398 type:complete len:243 (+) Transcript_27971:108-836(+)
MERRGRERSTRTNTMARERTRSTKVLRIGVCKKKPSQTRTQIVKTKGSTRMRTKDRIDIWTTTTFARRDCCSTTPRARPPTDSGTTPRARLPTASRRTRPTRTALILTATCMRTTTTCTPTTAWTTTNTTVVATVTMTTTSGLRPTGGIPTISTRRRRPRTTGIPTTSGFPRTCSARARSRRFRGCTRGARAPPRIGWTRWCCARRASTSTRTSARAAVRGASTARALGSTPTWTAGTRRRT